MSDLWVQGLEVSCLGMGITFAALGLLIVTMIFLERLFRPASRQAKERLPTVTAPATGVSEKEEIAAAIAVALAYFEDSELGKDALGATLELERGHWWHRGQRVSSRRGRKVGMRRQRQDE